MPHSQAKKPDMKFINNPGIPRTTIINFGLMCSTPGQSGLAHFNRSFLIGLIFPALQMVLLSWRRCFAGSALRPKIMLTRAVLVLMVWSLAGCAVSPIPLAGAPTGDAARVAALRGDSAQSLLLRGFDRLLLADTCIPAPHRECVYLIMPGRHVLWLKNAPYPLPLIPQQIRCYVIDAEFLAGVRYSVEEDIGRKVAQLLRTDTRQLVASGPLVDEPWIFASDCRWSSPPGT